MIEGARREGLAEGHAEGLVGGLVDVARKMLAKKMPLDTIIELTGLARAEIEGLN